MCDTSGLKRKALFTPAAFPAHTGDAPFYLDSAATALTHSVACHAVTAYYQSMHGSVHRSMSSVGEETTSAYEGARAEVAAFCGVAPRNIIFTSGTTSSINLVALSWAEKQIGEGDYILITQAEHHSNYVVWQQLAKRTHAFLVVLPVDAQTYTVSIDAATDAIATGRVKLCALTLDSNVIGPLWGPEQKVLKELLARLKKKNDCAVLFDAAQAAPHKSLTTYMRDADFVAFSPHKMGGPTGVGILAVTDARMQQMSPVMFGGGMVVMGGEEGQWQAVPHCFEAGTPPVAQAVATGALLKAYTYFDYATHQERMASYVAYFIEKVSRIEGITIVGSHEALIAHGHLVSFYHEQFHAHDIAAALSHQGVYVRAGDHCAQPLSLVWGGKPTVRVSFFCYTTQEAVAYCIEAIKKSIHDMSVIAAQYQKSTRAEVAHVQRSAS